MPTPCQIRIRWVAESGQGAICEIRNGGKEVPTNPYGCRQASRSLKCGSLQKIRRGEALLSRESLLFINVSIWRRQRQKGVMEAASRKDRIRQPTQTGRFAKRCADEACGVVLEEKQPRASLCFNVIPVYNQWLP